MHTSAMVRPHILQYIRIPTWNNSCGKFPPEQITKNMICAGKPCSIYILITYMQRLPAYKFFPKYVSLGGDDKDACQGDSGGPLGATLPPGHDFSVSYVPM